ncbi:MAG: aminoacetone oxidase family FAD-binding enzyme [Bacteroidales bacterium]|nr:aminoacetone oxidase family FAD-binding enzyme [Bacteroidales bacterium]
MKSEIIIIGGGAAGLMAAYGAAKALPEGSNARITILEKMPRPGRKILFTGKGRCNFTNVKEWNDFSRHIRTNPNFVKPSFYNFTPEDMIGFLEGNGLETVVERGDRAFPYSHRASDVLDTMVEAVLRQGVTLLTDREVESVQAASAGASTGSATAGFNVRCTSGETFECAKLIIATGGLSYPMTGSTGDGYRWAGFFGHQVTTTFPSLTALVPKGYKVLDGKDEGLKGHIHRETGMTGSGEALKGAKLKNVNLTVTFDGSVSETEFGDVDFTDGGIEGPVGFQVSRKCVKTLMNGGRVSFSLDLKPGVPLEELSGRVKTLWNDIKNDPRTRQAKDGRGINGKEMYRILLGKLMPWELIPGFQAWNPDILKTSVAKAVQGRFRKPPRRVYDVDLELLARTLKDWRFEIIGYVGYERCVITAGGISTDEVAAKTMESKLKEGLYFCGEVLDMDCDTGGYNLQCAFSTGFLAGQSAAKALINGNTISRWQTFPIAVLQS